MQVGIVPEKNVRLSEPRHAPRHKKIKEPELTEPALKASIWISAQVRTCNTQALPAMVRRHGDDDAGSILVRLDRLDGTSVLLSQIRNAEGNRAWLRVLGPEPAPDDKVETYITRRIQDDPDIWVLEIEDRKGMYVADAPIVD